MCVALVAASGLAASSVPAGASAPAANKKFCAAVNKISSEVEGSASSSAPRQAKALATSIRKAAKSAPKKIKAAMGTMASYFEAVGAAKRDPGKRAAALQEAKNYAAASAKFSSYVLSQCAKSQ